MPQCPACGHRFGDDLQIGKKLNLEMNKYINAETKEIAVFNETALTLTFTDKVTDKVTTWNLLAIDKSTGQLVPAKSPAVSSPTPITPVKEELPKQPIKPATLQGPAGAQQT